MAINYTTLTDTNKATEGSIRNWLNRADVPVTNILIEAEAYIYERLRVREMTAEQAVSILSGLGAAGAPADFLDPIQLVPYETAVELPYVQESALAQVKNAAGVVATGTPSRWTVIASTLKLDVLASVNYGATLTYFARPAALGPSNLTNFLTIRYPGLLRQACMAFGYQHMKKDDSATAFFALAEKSIQDANTTNMLWRRKQRSGHGGGSLSFATLTGHLEVEGSIRNWVKNVDAPAEIILIEAQAWLYERLRAREMLATAALTVAGLAASASLPADFLDPIQFLPYASEKELPYVDETALAQVTDAAGAILTGTPARWTAIGTSFVVDVRATVTYSGVLTYFAKPAVLASGNDTNFVTTRYPTALRLACLAFAYQSLQDVENASKTFEAAAKAIEEANATNTLWKRSQRPARTPTTFSYTLLTADKTVAGSIRNLIGNNELAAEVILTEAQALIYQRLRVREMITQAAFTFDADAESETLPTDFLDPIDFVPYEWGSPLQFTHEQGMSTPRDEDGAAIAGTPSQWTIKGAIAYVDVACAEDFAGILTYYALPAALSSGNATNFLTIRYPTLLRYACVIKGYEHSQQNDLALKLMVVFEKHLKDAMATNELYRRSQYVPGL